jgi:hypothetical protein
MGLFLIQKFYPRILSLDLLQFNLLGLLNLNRMITKVISFVLITDIQHLKLYLIATENIVSRRGQKKNKNT